MQVHPDKHQEYLKRHSPIWPELAQTLKDHGAYNYNIFLDVSRNLLFAYVEIESLERWNAVAETEVCQRWWRSMSHLMSSNADHSPLSSELTSVFYLP